VALNNWRRSTPQDTSAEQIPSDSSSQRSIAEPKEATTNLGKPSGKAGRDNPPDKQMSNNPHSAVLTLRERVEVGEEQATKKNVRDEIDEDQVAPSS
jgi:hypothetical protein